MTSKQHIQLLKYTYLQKHYFDKGEKMVSETLKAKVRLSNLKQYQIAHLVNIHPTTLSRIINGIEIVKDGDKRIIAIGKVLGLAEEECFATDEREHIFNIYGNV
jgi:hypothetical protein